MDEKKLLDCNTMFWEIDCQINGEDFFKENFGMNRHTFHKLCSLLHNMGRKKCNSHETLPLKKRVAIGLYTLSSSVGYRTVANKFGMAKCTVCKIFLEFCMESWKILFPMYLNNLPFTAEKVDECVY